MRRKALLLFAVLALVSVIVFVAAYFFLQEGPAKREPTEMIVTSIYPYELMVRQMTGGQIPVKTLIPQGASPHTWTPGPSDMQSLQDATVIVTNGLGLETNLAKAFSMHGAKHIEIAKLINHDLLKPNEEHDHHHHHEDAMHSEEHHHHHHHEEAMHSDEHEDQPDPHLWTSPENLINIANSLSAALINAFPNKTEIIKNNTTAMIQELMLIDNRIREERAKLTDPALVTYHNSFFYFTQRYDIDYVGFVQASPGQEPNPRELTNLGTKIRNHRIKSIFIEPQMNPKSAQVLAKEFNLKLLTLDPLGNSLGVRTISELILANWDIMKSGF